MVGGKGHVGHTGHVPGARELAHRLIETTRRATVGAESLGNDKVKPWASLNWPNRISLLRLLLVAPFVMLLMNQGAWAPARHVALVAFAMLAASDFVDGVLARRLGQRTRLGAMLDPLADKALIICSVVLLSLPDSAVPGARISNWVVVAIVGKDLWVILGFVVVYLVTDRIRIHPTLPGKVSTFGQLVMVGLTLIAPDLNRVAGGAGTQLAAVGGWIVAGLSIIAVISYTRLGLSYVAEQQPMENNGENQEE